MGAEQSTLNQEELEKMKATTNFTDNELKRLYRRFKKLDKDSNGVIDREEFLEIPELAANPLLARFPKPNRQSSLDFRPK